MGNWFWGTKASAGVVTEDTSDSKLNSTINRDERFAWVNKYTVHTHSDLTLRKDSKRPIKNQGNPFTNQQDPVHNIALQNAVAQPGGGKAQFVKHRTDTGDLYGGMSREFETPNVNVVTKPDCCPDDHSSTYQSIESLQNHYFAGGARADTLGLVQTNTPHEGDRHKMLMRYGNIHGDRKKYTNRPTNRDFETIKENNSISTACTSFDKSVVGNKAYNVVRYDATTNLNEPPKMIVSSQNLNLFANK